jgi:alanine dehydrogenase
MGSLLLGRLRNYSTKIIGLLRETKNKWECRVPLTPENVMDLKKEWGDQLDFQIQPSRKRIFQDDEYIKVAINEARIKCVIS